MVPAFTLLLAFNLTSAMRVLFTIAIVLVSLNRRDVRETGAESVLSALIAGAVAVAFSVLYTFWPQPGAALLAMAFLGLLWFRGLRGGAGEQWRWRCRWSGGCSGPRRAAAVEDAGLVPTRSGRALRGLGARADPGDAGLAGGSQSARGAGLP